MTALSQALTDIKKHLKIEEVKNLSVDFIDVDWYINGKLPLARLRFSSEGEDYVVEISKATDPIVFEEGESGVL